MKNHIVLVNDKSGSMDHLAKQAINDYNTNIETIKNAATREELDTVVSVLSFGINSGVKREVVVSNPHVLKKITSWPVHSQTPLWDAVGDAIELLESVPDSGMPDVSYLVLTTTDGGENASRKYSKVDLARKIQSLQNTDKWTFVFRVPKGQRHMLNGLGVPESNIVEWETSAAGMAASTVVTTQAMDSYFSARSAGAKGSSVFYANAAAVNTAVLKDITKDVSLYVVPVEQDGIQIRDFVLTKRQVYLKGSAFYQLSKTESRVSHTKLIAVRDRTTGSIYSGADARKMLGLPTNANCRLHPGDHGNFDIFIQSESVNRKLVGGYGLMYWPAIGVPYADNDPMLQYGQPKTVVNGVVQLPAVPVSTKPTPSPIAKTPKPATMPDMINGQLVQFFATRDGARDRMRGTGKSVKDAGDYGSKWAPGKRWFVFI